MSAGHGLPGLGTNGRSPGAAAPGGALASGPLSRLWTRVRSPARPDLDEGRQRGASEEERVRRVYAQRHRGDPRYSWASPAHVWAVQERERAVVAALRRHGRLPLAGRPVLDVGCGTGAWLRDFVRWGARPEDLHGIDLLPDRIDEARALCPSAVSLRCGSAARLPFPDRRFDIVLQATVFTSVLDPAVRRQIAAEMLRVCRPDGIILWYDFHVDNPANPDVRGVGRREVSALFAGCRVELRRIGLAPPLARRIAPRSRLAVHLLAALPPLRTHYLGVIRRDADGETGAGGER